MGIEKLTSLAIVLALAAVGTGRLPKILRTVQTAQIQLLKESRTHTWGRLMLLK